MNTKQVALYQLVARAAQARWNCIEKDNHQWKAFHEDRIHTLAKELPSGSGFDSGSMFVLDECDTDKITIATQFHHMNENGMYTKWTKHKIIVTPSLAHGFHLKITGRNHNDIKDYIGELFDEVLRKLIEVNF